MALPQSPRETLLDEIHHALALHLSDRFSHRVCQRPRPTHRHRHRAYLLPHLLGENHLRFRPAGHDLHRSTGAIHIPAVLRPRDEELDVEALPPARHLQDLLHPRPDPLERLAVPDDPDQCYLARSDHPLVAAANEMLHVANLVRDARCAGEEDAVAIGIERVVSAVWPFESGCDGKALTLAFLRHVVQPSRHSRLGLNYE